MKLFAMKKAAKIGKKSAIASNSELKSNGKSYDHSDDFLVFNDTGVSSGLQYKKKGAPIHTISFNDKIRIIDSGISKRELLLLKDRFGFSLETLSNILDITDRTIQNKPHEFRFTGNVAEKIMSLSELYSYGMDVFEERSKFIKWLDTPSQVLNNKRPLDLFRTMLGMELVKQELGRIDYGIY